MYGPLQCSTRRPEARAGRNGKRATAARWDCEITPPPGVSLARDVLRCQARACAHRRPKNRSSCNCECSSTTREAGALPRQPLQIFLDNSQQIGDAKVLVLCSTRRQISSTDGQQQFPSGTMYRGNCIAQRYCYKVCAAFGSNL